MIGKPIMSIGESITLPHKNPALTFVNRFVDRDMLMRYHWGLGVGHVHSHGLVGVPTTVEDETDGSLKDLEHHDLKNDGNQFGCNNLTLVEDHE